MTERIVFGRDIPCYFCQGTGKEPGDFDQPPTKGVRRKRSQVDCPQCKGRGVVENKGPIPWSAP